MVKTGAHIFAALLTALAATPANSQIASTYADIEFSFEAEAAIVASAHELSGGVQSLFAADIEWEGISDNGWRWGLALGVQAQNDKARRGFGQSIDPLSNRNERSLATGRYQGGQPVTQDSRFAADAAFLFLRTGKGSFRVGLTEGAAVLETLDLPTGALFARLDGGPLAITGHSPILANNQTGGLGPALVYSTPRIIGLRASVSYAPESNFCGIDICRDTRRPGVPETALENVAEIGVSFDHVFREFGQVEASLNVTFADPRSGIYSKEYTAIGYGARWSGDAWSIGVLGLWSDNAVNSGDYSSTAIALRHDGDVWSVGGELAISSDDWIDEEAVAAQITLSRLLGDQFGVAFGLHWQDREWARQGAQATENMNENGVGVFVEMNFIYR